MGTSPTDAGRRLFLRTVTVGGSAAVLGCRSKSNEPAPANPPMPPNMQDWTAENAKHVAQTVKNLPDHSGSEMIHLLRRVKEFNDGAGIDQLEHCLQTATRALRDGAHEEMVVAALCHDAGKVFTAPNHGAVVAEILRPHVADEIYEVVRNHMVFESRYWGKYFAFDGPGKTCTYPTYMCSDPEAYKNFADRPWYNLAMKFATDWDSQAFDPR